MLQKDHEWGIDAAYYAKKSYIKKNPGIIQKFTNAIYRGQIWVGTHTPGEVADAIKDSFPDSDKELLMTVAKRYKEQDTWCKDPFMKKEALGLLQEAYLIYPTQKVCDIITSTLTLHFH